MKLPEDALKEQRAIISNMVDVVMSDQRRLAEHSIKMGKEKSEQPACVCQDTLRIHRGYTEGTLKDTLRDTLRDTLQGYTSGHTAGHREDAPQDAPQDMLHSHPLLVMQVASSRDGRTGRARREAQSLLRWMW